LWRTRSYAQSACDFKDSTFRMLILLHMGATHTKPGSGHYLGSLPVSEKTNEIPVARELFKKVDIIGRLVGLDALHTQMETARDLVMEHGGDYLFTEPVSKV